MKTKSLSIILILISYTAFGQEDDSMHEWIKNRFDKFHKEASVQLLTDEENYEDKQKFRLSYLPSFDKPVIISIERIKREVIVQCSVFEVQKDESFKLEKTVTNKFGIVEWGEFNQRIKDALFWHLKTNSYDLGVDGSAWLVEAVDQIKDNQHHVYVWSPRGSFKEIGTYLFKLAGLKME